MQNRVQLTTDGHAAYLAVVADVFQHEVDYTTLVKLYGPDPKGRPAPLFAGRVPRHREAPRDRQPEGGARLDVLH